MKQKRVSRKAPLHAHPSLASLPKDLLELTVKDSWIDLSYDPVQPFPPINTALNFIKTCRRLQLH